MIYASKKRFKFLGHEVRFALAIKPWNGIVEGCMALCEDGMYVVMADYDKCPMEIIDYELKTMQRKYGLGNFYVLESSPGKFQAISFDKVEFREYLEILKQLRIDPGYTQSRTFVLRTGPKKGNRVKLHHVIECTGRRELSRAHLNYYITVMPGLKGYINIQQLDNSKELMGVNYTT
jgi:hypothetical protein